MYIIYPAGYRDEMPLHMNHALPLHHLFAWLPRCLALAQRTSGAW